MRLYLSSYRLGDSPHLLAGLVSGERTGWIIANALDGLDETRRVRASDDEAVRLRELGLHGRDFDLRLHSPATIAEAFGQPDFVWVRGGNVFTLRAAMARSGADELIASAVQSDALTYGGYSAGACVLAPSLAGLEHCDPTDISMAVYGMIRFDGLGVLDRPVVPHLSSPGHPETAALEEVAARYRASGQPYWGLRDGQVLVADDSPLTLH